MRVFLDANVLFSASNSGSNLSRLIALLLKTHDAVTSDLARDEARRNIALKRPAWSLEFERLMDRIEVVPSAAFMLSVKLAAQDVPILCAAIRAACQYLVTGDKKDFGHLYNQTVEGVTVISVLHLAEILTEGTPH